MSRAHSAPSLFDTVTEPLKLFSDAASGFLNAPLIAMLTPSGKGRAVIITPGFSAHGASLAPLHIFLEFMKGYKTYDWGGGVNTGSARANIQDLKDLIKRANDETGMPAGKVGHSFGGIIGKQAANDLYQELLEERMIYQMVTLGSPLNPSLAKESSEGVSGPIYNIFNALNPHDHPRVIEAKRARQEMAEKGLPGIPVTSVYSRFDGVVHHDAAFTRLRGENKESVEIYSGHLGMGMNAMAGLVIADRLGQSTEPEDWKPFDPAKYGCLAKMAFPKKQYHEGRLQELEANGAMA